MASTTGTLRQSVVHMMRIRFALAYALWIFTLFTCAGALIPGESQPMARSLNGKEEGNQLRKSHSKILQTFDFD